MTVALALSAGIATVANAGLTARGGARWRTSPSGRIVASLTAAVWLAFAAVLVF